MNILLINHYTGSNRLGMEYRPYYFAKEWIRLGHHTTIVAATYSHIRSNNPEFKDKFHYDDSEGIEYLWIKTPKYASNSPRRFLNMLVFICRLFRISRRIMKKRKYDVVIASSTYPLDIFPAAKIARLSKAQLIFEVHDLWPLSPMELGGYSKWHPFIMLMQYAENFAYRKSDKVVSLLPKTKEHMMAHGLAEEKWFCIPNGINKSEWDDYEEIPSDVHSSVLEIKKKYSCIIAYTGTYGLANALDSFLDAAKLVKDIPVAFVLFGKGPLSSHLTSRVEKESIANVFIFDVVPKRSIPHLLSFFDYLYLGLQNQPLFRFGISPNKLMDYMMSGKPIVQAINAGNDMVKDAGCGISVEPENPEAIAKAIRTLYGMSDQELEILGENGKMYVLMNHMDDALANKFIDVISQTK
jgi:glycosyltransferase involved in cell wall biosynthesis